MTCKQCGITLTNRRKHIGFCSKKCNFNNLNGEKPTKPTCIYCKETFTAQRKTAKYCTPTCQQNVFSARPYTQVHVLKHGELFKLQLVKRRNMEGKYVTFDTKSAVLLVEKHGTEWQTDMGILEEIWATV